ncbi:MAG: HDIG domain-containing protein [Deltaproteobacteria bacterium]|nr:HDIG domain-containing protein [Deltaproteobacteria bacterium]MBW2069212.1 HDIG domain-containing protein [Deltaproteobacteria bacterium]
MTKSSKESASVISAKVDDSRQKIILSSASFLSFHRTLIIVGGVLSAILSLICLPSVVGHGRLLHEGFSSLRLLTMFLAGCVFCFVGLSVPFYVGQKHVLKKSLTDKDLVFLGSLIAIASLLTYTMSWLQVHLTNVPDILRLQQDLRIFVLILPVAAAAMIVVTFFDVNTALLFSIILCTFLTVILESNLWIFLYFLLSSFLGIHWLYPYHDRFKPIRAGIFVGLFQGFLVGLFLVLRQPSMGWELYPLYTLAAIMGGILSGVLASGLIPLVEYLFDYTTDTRLMELATMDHPLLRELMLQAPGTYHHSIIVGNMVEIAAKSIGANALLAKVAAYYHDIGKIKKPLYFIENQFDCENRHAKLAPSMSSLILISHVKDGVELARKYKLGQPIVDIIQQHHGTSLIAYFYQKALECRERVRQSKKGTELPPVNEEDFRYPGPKPQTKEAGLVMLADMAEAACRSIPNPTPARIQGMVNRVINQAFADGQLDECELTLKDLHKIAKHFNQILSTIHHKRIEYPSTATAKFESHPKCKETGNGRDTDQKSAAQSGKSEANKANSGTDLKRLGLQ